MQKLKSSIFDLVAQTSTNLPPDVSAAMAAAMKAEASNSRVGSALDIIFANIDMAISEGFRPIGREIVLRSPISEDEVRKLRIGDVVVLQGRVYTRRDAVHSFLMKNPSPVDLSSGVLYHCGPVAIKQNGRWEITAGGPTTSIRLEPYQAEIIKRFGIRAVIGKGGMGSRTLSGLKESGAVCLHAIGGAAQDYARCIFEIRDVLLTEFGLPDAMWLLEVKDFPAMVTMNEHGNSLHADVEKASAVLLEKLKDPVF